MLRIVMDSGGDLPPEWIEKYDIDVIPVNVHFGEKMYLEDVDMSIDDFYTWVEQSGVIPKSSQPTPQQFIQLYQQVAEPGDIVLSIHITSKLSGTYNSAILAAAELEDAPFEVIPFDSLTGAGAEGYMACEARIMDRRGASVEEIIERLEEIRDSNEIIFALDTLAFAQKSGRVRKVQVLAASLLRVKPIVALNNGMLDIIAKVRTRKASLEYVIQEVHERIGDQPINAAVMHAHDVIAASEFAEKVKKILDCKNIFIEEVSTGIAANLGPGTLGLVAYPTLGGIF
ncbi:MAG: DegV family protein [Chloroflexota bacterium]|nr:DegV family protein [Chloroflexota bacterium]